MGYCLIENVPCQLTNSEGYCSQTGCTNNEVFKKKLESANSNISYHVRTDDNDWASMVKTVRECQICGNPTESLDMYICEDCRRKLKNLMATMK